MDSLELVAVIKGDARVFSFVAGKDDAVAVSAPALRVESYKMDEIRAGDSLFADFWVLVRRVLLP